MRTFLYAGPLQFFGGEHFQEMIAGILRQSGGDFTVHVDCMSILPQHAVSLTVEYCVVIIITLIMSILIVALCFVFIKRFLEITRTVY